VGDGQRGTSRNGRRGKGGVEGKRWRQVVEDEVKGAVEGEVQASSRLAEILKELCVSGLGGKEHGAWVVGRGRTSFIR
jgi:hypothetical protein